MDRAGIRLIYDQDQRIDVEYPGNRREVTPHVVRLVGTGGHQDGAVIYSRLDAFNADAVIREQLKYFKHIGQSLEWKLYDYDQPPDLKERLQSHGFEIEESEAIMVLDLDDAPAALWQPIGHDVRLIASADQLSVVMDVQRQVWDEDFAPLTDYLTAVLNEAPDQMRIYVAYVDGKPASAAWIYFPLRSQFGSLWGGSTVSEFRSQGLYTALLATRAQDARLRGVRYLTVDASPMSRPILEKFRFEMISTSWPCKWKPASTLQSD